MTSSRFALLAELRCLEGHEDAVGALLTRYAETVRAEPGNRVFAPWRTERERERILVYEEYDDEAAFRAHLASTHNHDFNGAVAEHLVGGGSALTMLAPL